MSGRTGVAARRDGASPTPPAPLPDSLWVATAPRSWADRPPLDGDTEADVCVVGAGYTGLWTAYYLNRLDPLLRVVVVEAEVAGFGASGRNGGWCTAEFAVPLTRLAVKHGARAALAQYRELRRTVDEVGRVVREERIGCGWAKGGTLYVARTPPQLARARAEVALAERSGLGDVELLDAPRAKRRIGVPDALGATYTPHCARVQPFALARGLARRLDAYGVRIAERTRALTLAPGRVVTDRGTVTARHVIRATEAWTPGLPGAGRAVVPVYSLIVATEPLPASFWDGAGLARAETFSDFRHLIVYGQRTADDRLVLGGRGAPYHAGSAVRPAYDTDPRVFAALRASLAGLFPGVEKYAVTHAWGGPLAIPRDWYPSVAYDQDTGLGRAGGYVGEGVAAANLAGRTLADLVLGRATDRTALPWVGHRSPSWEPEPVRWLGVNAGRRLAALADREESWTGRPALSGRLLALLTGH